MATKTKPTAAEAKNIPDPAKSVQDVLAFIEDESLKADTLVLIDLMSRISGQKPKLWNAGTLGFDTYHYKYESGREGDCHILGLYPRKGKLTLYLMDGTTKYSDLLAGLGKHTTSKACLYFKHLSDIQLPVLEKVLQQSYKYVKALDGKMHRAVE